METCSPAETFQVGERIGRALTGGSVVALVGPLGAGKTQLVKGLAAGVGEGDSRKVTSPTFTLVQEYRGRLTLYHIDAYRLKSAVELTSLGFEEMIRSDSVVVVEWADRVHSLIPSGALTIRIEPTGDTSRKFHLGGSSRDLFDVL
jgi:tRNA threonylcarbamoyladenosine biosynthesis protein TsaE